MIYNVTVSTSQVRALLLAGIAVTSFAAVSCSANPGPVKSVTDFDIVVGALENGGYEGVHRANGDEASAQFGSCTLLAEFDPTANEPLRVTSVLLSKDGASYPLRDQYVPTAEELKAMPIVASAGCM
jgi:hypothetical protein